jgi:hypothetical protein
LDDQADVGSVNFGNYEARGRIIDNPSTSGTFMLEARNGGGFAAPLAIGLRRTPGTMSG